MATDVYDFWRRSLKGERPPIDVNNPQPGFYRRRYGKGQPWLPAAIWIDVTDKQLRCRVGDKAADPMAEWTWVADKPMPQEAVKHAFKNGNAWPNDVSLPAEIGDNSDIVDVAEITRDYVAECTAWMKQIGGRITTDALAEQAGNRKRELQKLRKKVEEKSKAEQQPLKDQIAAIVERWKPVAEDVSAIELAIGGALKAHGDAVLEAQRKAREAEERRRADEARKAQEEARAKAAADRADDPDGLGFLHDQEAALDAIPAPPPPPPKPKVSFGGQAGAKVAMRTRRVAHIHDYDAALKHFARHEKVAALIQQLADAAARSQIVVPGCEIKEDTYVA